LPNQIESVGAKLTLTFADGSSASKWFVRGEGLSSDSSPVLIFGLGGKSASSLTIKYLTGEERVIDGPFGDGAVDLRQSEILSERPTGE